MELWKNNHIDEIIEEAHRCDRQLKTKSAVLDKEQELRIFSRMVLQGRLRDATRWITERDGGCVLSPEDITTDGKTVFNILEEKHPPQQMTNPDYYLQENLPLLIEVDITAGHIEKVARTLRGSAGPSGTDADQWKDFLLRFGAHSERLREAIASSTRWLANGIIEWDRIKPLMARRGVALDKCPGVRPIGIGELIQRIMAKAMVLVTKEDLQEMCGADQLCAGTKSGIEAAIHAAEELFERNETEGFLLVDAANAFNAISRPMMLWNARILWPRCSRFLFNTYRGYSYILYRNSSKVILSREGTTQGDPLGMLMYGVGILPLIRKLKSQDCTQTWYADDSSCIGKLLKIKEWLELLMKEGPKIGYFPEPRKSYIVVKPQFEENARKIFEEYNIQIVTSHRFLGGCIGDDDGKRNFVKNKVADWIKNVKIFSKAAEKFPQPAFAAYTKSLQCQWMFLQRVLSGYEDEYIPLNECIRQQFIPALFGAPASELEKDIFSLPVRFGGLGIRNPMDDTSHENSRNITKVLVECIKEKQPLNLPSYIACAQEMQKTIKKKEEETQQLKYEELTSQLPEERRHTLERIVKHKCSQWLTMLPTIAENTDLSSQEFRDALDLRYRRIPINLPNNCDGCGDKFSITHALNCKKGGLVKFGHDNHRDFSLSLAKLAWCGVATEPIMKTYDPVTNSPALIADMKIDGVWESGRRAFFDFRITNADAPSYTSRPWKDISELASKEKHKKYDRAAEDLRAAFTPLIVSCDGALHHEYEAFEKRLAGALSEKWKKARGEVLNWIRKKRIVSIIRAISMRIRGSRKKLEYLACEDGAGLC